MFGDPPGEVAPARMAARELRYPYRRGHDRRDARRRHVLQRWAFSAIPGSGWPAPWTPGARNCWPTSPPGGLSNRPTEAINLLIKPIKRGIRPRIPGLQQPPTAATTPRRASTGTSPPVTPIRGLTARLAA